MVVQMPHKHPERGEEGGREEGGQGEERRRQWRKRGEGQKEGKERRGREGLYMEAKSEMHCCFGYAANEGLILLLVTFNRQT